MTCLVCPLDSLRRSYLGIITSHDLVLDETKTETIVLSINWENKTIFGDEDMLDKLSDVQCFIEQRLLQASTPKEFYHEVERMLNLKFKSKSGPSMHLLKRIHEELKEFQTSTTVKVDVFKRTIEFFLDEDVKMNVLFDENYPMSPPKVTCSFPLHINHPWISQTSKLKDIYDHYSKTFNEIKEIKKLLEAIDDNLMTTKTNNPYTRKVYSTSNLTIQLDFDPFFPEQIPKVSIFGSETETDQTYRSLRSNKGLWLMPNENSIISLLEKVLNVGLKKKEAQMLVREEGETCPICYAELQQSEVKATCEICYKIYHDKCIRDWCINCPNFRISFGYMFGTCPTCESPISLKPTQ